MGDSLLIKNATVVTMDEDSRVFAGDVLVEGHHIAAVGAGLAAHADETIDASGRVLLPGLVQTHIHLCQTMFRGAADDLALIDWLKRRIWPMEAAHTPASVYASARLGIAEMMRGGTTTALTMETVHHTAEVFRAVEETGFRATVGKCMMDKGDDVPAALHEATDASIAESLALLERWHGAAGGRIRYCFAPRFAVSCTRELLERVARLSDERGVIVHTHASENRDEVALVERETGLRNIEYFKAVGLITPRVVLAHCVQLSDDEMAILEDGGAQVAHCPSSNLKLGSGIARVSQMIARGIRVTIGADGAPCNNRLDMFTEMRTAALLQKVLCGPEALPALTVLRMATIDGARALGLADEIGSIEAGKRADLVLLNLDALHTTPRPDVISTIVYAAQASDVEAVWIDGRTVFGDGRLTTMDEREVIAVARQQAAQISALLNE
jgi:5-methylthioadenosine/S-adenosylhomocysteine deaminase